MFKSNILLLLLLVAVSVKCYPQNELAYDYEDDEGVPEEEPEIVDDTPPEFDTPPQHVKARLGATVKFPCTTTQDQSNRVLIFKHFQTLPEGSKSNPKEALLFVGSTDVLKKKRYSFANGTFQINGVKAEDAGTFVCHYQLQTVVELAHTLDVLLPPKMISHSDDQKVRKGDSATLKCKASGNPTPVITWSRNEGRMPSGKESEEALEFSLDDVNRHVEGTYKCTATNEISSASAEMKVSVEYSPEIITEKEIIRTGEGDRVELVCIVHARPAARLVWSKDGGQVDYENNVSEHEGGHRHILTISDVTENNFGEYQCAAENALGSTASVISLTDLPKHPEFTSNPNSGEETSYTLTWNTESFYPIEEYRIRFRKTKVNETNDEPGPWSDDEVVEAKEDQIEMDGLHHQMRHTIHSLEPATDYEALVAVKNKDHWGNESIFRFSTKKASPSTSSSTTTTTSPPQNLVDAAAAEEVSSPVTDNGSSQPMICLALLIVSSLAIVPFSS